MPLSVPLVRALFAFLLLFLSHVRVDADELLSARCQTNCLHQLETRAAEDADLKRHLKHHIINICKEDDDCSSCTAACQEDAFDLNGCHDDVCRHVKNAKACKQSCEYLREIYGNKPGTCLNSSHLAPSNECSALCHMDGDCPETKKCCAVGCSRQCLKPRGKDRHLLPVPTSITVQERKRKRSVVVRWVIQQMSREQMNSNSNLYVVQWRWSIHKDGAPMSDWQTIVTRNKMYAILKHLLAPGRYYMFRVAAVNTHGSLGFSKSSQPFKLSKEPRAPGQPRDLSLASSELDQRNFWTQRLKWTSPLSELPIKNYILSWQKSTVQQAAAYEELIRRRSAAEKQGKRSALNEDDEENENEESFLDRERMSIVVPAYHSYADIDQLLPASVYLVEIHATVDSSDGELHGEKAIIYVRTGQINNSESATIKISSTATTATMTTTSGKLKSESGKDVNDIKDVRRDAEIGKAMLNIRAPYFDDDNLKTVVSWFNGDSCAKTRSEYMIRWRLMMCQAKDGQRHTYYDLDTSGEDWAQMQVQECVAVLEDLDFACSYNVELIAGNTKEMLATGHFQTQSCEQTPSTLPLACANQQSFNALFCIVNSANSSARCNWKDTNGAVKNERAAGYRVVLSASSSKVNNQIVIKSPQSTTVQFDKLEPDCDYLVYVQTITSSGLGNTLTTSFRTNRSSSAAHETQNSHKNYSLSHVSSMTTHGEDKAPKNIDPESVAEESDSSYARERFPGAAVLELPLESSAARVVRWTCLCFVCIDVLLRFLVYR